MALDESRVMVLEESRVMVLDESRVVALQESLGIVLKESRVVLSLYWEFMQLGLLPRYLQQSVIPPRLYHFQAWVH